MHSTVPLTMFESMLDTLNAQAFAVSEITAWLAEHHADLAGFYIHPASTGVGVMIQVKDQDQLAEATRIVKAGAPIGSITKDYGEEIARVTRRFGVGIVEVYGMRENVCERIIVGTETVEVPDPDAPLVTVEREIVRWECHPILSEVSA